MNPRTPLLIDKNILQGWGKPAICELAEKYELLMADALFFELLSGDPIARYRDIRILDAANPNGQWSKRVDALRKSMLMPVAKPSTDVCPAPLSPKE